MINTRVLKSIDYQGTDLWSTLDCLQNAIGYSYCQKEAASKYFTGDFLASVQTKADIEELYRDYHKFHKSLIEGDVTVEFVADIISRVALILKNTTPDGLKYLGALKKAAEVLEIPLSSKLER